ncbi:transcriptional regulator [Streptomyces tubercidicus]|uniref:transcriptional regulator n=1 Tax=Streptomyces tubercidicus TaxID=47759 RepID=UPI002E148F04|nr:helix-turn-helix domain-containing protein [Streptomyces tubercidicus]
MSNEQRVRVGTETEEFARLLRRLKDRSGRSYGVLAGQLHMSVSTLHRYCNGDAVPMDFAPADRLARRCGATSDELVELHRRWILADEARRRSRAAGSSGGTSPGSAASSAPTPSPASTEPSAPASSSTDEPPASSPDKPATSSTGKPAASPTEPTDTTPDPAPDLPSTPPSADEAPGEDAPEVPTDPVAVRRTPARRTYLRIALALSAVACLAIPAALAVNDSKGSDSQRRTAGGADRDPGAARADGGKPTQPSASPSPGRSAADGEPTPGGKARHSPPGHEGPDGSGASRAPEDDRDQGGTAPHVGISSYNWQQPCGVNFLLQKSPDRVPPPPPPQDSRGWARAEGGIDGGHLRLQLTATGRTDAAVVLTSLHVRMVGRHTALPWTAYSMGDGCGGGITPRSFDLDLDDAQPLAKPVAGEDGDIVVPAKNFPFKVSTQDPQVLNLDLHTEEHDVSWYLEVGWSSGGRRGTVRVDDEGKPFRMSAIEGRKHYYYQPDTNHWAPK